jgi:MFS family permease
LNSPQSDPAAGKTWISRGILGIGASSFFSDAGHEIVTAVLPTFLVSTLHATAAALGIIEGVSDSLTGIAALVAGPWANDPERRGLAARGGYIGTALATGAIGLSVATWQVGLLRAVAWTSRGLRSPARDSLLASLAPEHAYGRAYGVERAGDNLGAVVGPLLAAGLVTWVGIRPTIYCAFIPGALAAITITFAAREARRSGGSIVPRRAGLQLRVLREAGVVRALVPIALFELGNVATTLLILRATELLHNGATTLALATLLAILLYSGHNAFGAVVALLGGHWLDRASARLVFATGAGLYVLAYVGFSLPTHSPLALLAAFALAGCGIGLAETAESTLFARLLPDNLRGSGFGVLGATQAVGDLTSSAVVGILYVAASPAVGFGYAAAWMFLSVISVAILDFPKGSAGPLLRPPAVLGLT